jgi:hypothetical protein
MKPDGITYTLRRDGVIACTSTIPGCGYSSQELRELRAAGFELYADGKKVK